MTRHSLSDHVTDKKDETVRVENTHDLTQDVAAVPVDHRPEILRQFSAEDLLLMEKKLVRRLDFRCLPILILLFLLNILDRNAIANARLGGLEADLGMSDSQYQTAIMVR